MSRIKPSELLETLQGFDSCHFSISEGRPCYIARRSFFYQNGRTAEKCVADILLDYPNAKILAHGEVRKPFKGGEPIQRQSHWFVKFTI